MAGHRRGGLGHPARLPTDRPDTLQVEVRAGRRRVSQTPLAVLQKDADCARLRHKAQCPGLYGLFRPPDRRLAEEFHLVSTHHALGPERSDPAVRGFRREIDRRSPSQRGGVVLKYYRTLGLRDDAIDYVFAAGPTDISYLTFKKRERLASIATRFRSRREKPQIATAPKSQESQESIVPKSTTSRPPSDAKSLVARR